MAHPAAVAHSKSSCAGLLRFKRAALGQPESRALARPVFKSTAAPARHRADQQRAPAPVLALIGPEIERFDDLTGVAHVERSARAGSDGDAPREVQLRALCWRVALDRHSSPAPDEHTQLHAVQGSRAQRASPDFQAQDSASVVVGHEE